MTGRVVSGTRNVFTVKTEEPAVRECRIKGKVLKSASRYYNPLAPGDRVEFDAASGLILSAEPRRNAFTRFNTKGNAPQIIAANVDAILCLTSPASPPFRPRFIDRLLLQADSANIPAMIACNKRDLFPTVDAKTRLEIEARLADFARLDYEVFLISAKTGEGLDALKSRLKGSVVVLVGQSGSGKTSLINALLPGVRRRTGPVNRKYDRGNHTTVMSELLEDEAEGIAVIDTPGIRSLAPDGIAPDEVQQLMRDFAPFAGKCAFGLSCAHQNEAGCKIREAVSSGAIHGDRFESFVRITKELAAGEVRDKG
ncbi:MAG: ribosome small subunit-dependent GTPase A, partial [Spirochaetaceae bacterium]|jgi:ribosome biogenesis GTPase|nr:ribosome small subunit-dependent GTPase A [Spirochaetaceae bacterium]